MTLSLKPARTAFAIAFFVLFLYMMPYILEWDNAIVAAHDNLDSAFSYYVTLALEGKTFALDPNAKVERVMHGLPRMFFPSGFNVLAILCFIFPPYVAYLLNFITIHSLAFVGMLLLLRKHILQSDSDLPVVIFSSLAFALIPFYTVIGLSVAGIPLLLYSFLNFYRKKAATIDYIIFGLFPFYSFFVLSGLFLIVCAGLCLVFVRVGEGTWHLVKPIILLVAGYLIAEYQMFYQMLFRGDLISHRVEFVIEKMTFEASVESARNLFLNMQYHASNPPHFIIPVFILALILAIVRKHEMSSWLIMLFVLNVFISVIHAMYSWALFSDVIKNLPFINSFQWDRFYFFAPIIWYVAFAIAVKVIFDSLYSIRWGVALIVFIFSCQFYFLWRDSKEYQETVYNLVSKNHYGTSFKDFYAAELFTQIRDFLGRPQSEYTVGSIAFHPAVAQYNGFYTIDGYQNNYFLSYKKEFRKIIERELAKNAIMTRYFDEWGSRCYLFVNGIYPEFSITKWAGYSAANPDLNFNEGPEVDYIFSAVEIVNPAASNLELMKLFNLESSIYKIYVYRLDKGVRQRWISEINEFPVTDGILGVSAEIAFNEDQLRSVKHKHEVLPRHDLLKQASRFAFLAIDGQGRNVNVVRNPSNIKPEEFNIHLMSNYWDYNNDALTVAAPTTLSSLPIGIGKGSYELLITGESSVVENVTSHVVISYGERELGQEFLPAANGVVTVRFEIDKPALAPLHIRYTNDFRTPDGNDRNFWLRNITIRKVK
jgi:hypothetical protein